MPNVHGSFALFVPSSYGVSIESNDVRVSTVR